MNWASLVLPMGWWWADASMDPPEMVSTVQVRTQLGLRLFCSSMPERQLTAKLDKRVEVEELCVSEALGEQHRAKTFLYY